MMMKNTRDLFCKSRRSIEIEKSARRVAVVMAVIGVVGLAAAILSFTKSGKKACVDLKKAALNTAENVKDSVHSGTDMVKSSVSHAAQEANDTIKIIRGKTQSVKNDVKNGINEIASDIDHTAENISSDIKNLKNK